MSNLVQRIMGVFERVTEDTVDTEPQVQVFISSNMGGSVDWARDIARDVCESQEYFRPWAFEERPASSKPPDELSVQRARESDILILLLGSETPQIVVDEYEAAIDTDSIVLAYKLPVPERDDRTQNLLSRVRGEVTYDSISEKGRFRERLESAFQEAIVDALRRAPGGDLRAYNQQLISKARARSIERWQAAGVRSELARELADDLSVGEPPDRAVPSAENPLTLVVGSVGAGKSLTADRILMEEIRGGEDEGNRRIPVYVSADSLESDLENYIDAHLGDHSLDRRAPLFIVIDGLDEAGVEEANQLVQSARRIVHERDENRALLTSRPIPPFSEMEERVPLPSLDRDEAVALAERIVGRELPVSITHSWPDSVRIAIQRPLFAVLIGVYYRDHDRRRAPQKQELIASVASTAIERVDQPSGELRGQVERLARQSADRGGGPVPRSEIPASQINPLIDTRMVVGDDAGLRFALPILSQWFAGQSLLSGEPPIDDLCQDRQRLQQWRDALGIAITTGTSEEVTPLLETLVPEAPGVAGEIINEGIPSWPVDEDIAPPPALESGRRIREAMQSWYEALGHLIEELDRATPSGEIYPIAARVDGVFLRAGWCYPGKIDDDVIRLDAFTRPKAFHERSLRPGGTPAWSWRWTLEDIRGELEEPLRSHQFVSEGPLLDEILWAVAQEHLGRGSLSHEPMELDKIAPIFEDRADTYRLHVGRTELRPHAISLLKDRIQELQDQGQEELQPPWPGPDNDLAGGGWVWDPYSPSRLRDRVEAIYQMAITGYSQLVDQWFQPLKPRLSWCNALPVRFVGDLKPPTGEGYRDGPSMSYYVEPKPHSEMSEVDIRLLEEGDDPLPDFDRDQHFDRWTRMRPDASKWMRIPGSGGTSLSRIFERKPATERAYDWIEDDLRGLGFT